MRVGSAPSCLLSEPHKISLTHKSSSAAAAASFRMTDAKGRKLVGWSTAPPRMQRREKERGRRRRRKMFASVAERAASLSRL